MDRDTGAIVAALILAPMAVVVLVALLRGYKVDIHFERDSEGHGFFRRKRQDPPEHPPDKPGSD